MARIARVVAPGYPHHVVQRGNRRQTTFFSDEDYETYLNLMAQWCDRCKVNVWAYCLMPNHVHLTAVPDSEDGLRRAIGEAHRRYTRRINFREGWRGHLWQGRFGSFPMGGNYLLAAARYVEFNPVRAGLVERPEVHPWSSAKAHVAGCDDILVKVEPLLKMVGDWGKFLGQDTEESVKKDLRFHERTGRPLGDESFLLALEEQTGRSVRPHKRGPKVMDGGN